MPMPWLVCLLHCAKMRREGIQRNFLLGPDVTTKLTLKPRGIAFRKVPALCLAKAKPI